MPDATYTIGLDYGTQSVRALVVDVRTGEKVGTGVFSYPSGSDGTYVDPDDLAAKAWLWKDHTGHAEAEEITETARRKGLTVKFCRRMGEVYARPIQLVAEDCVALAPLVTHRFSLEETPEALALQSRYDDGVIKAVVHPTGSE